MDLEFTAKEWLGLAGAALAVVAAFLPWRQTPGGAVTGVEGIGVVTLVVGGLAGGAIALATWSEQGVVATALGGLLVLAVALSQVLGLGGPVSPAVGVYLTIVAGVALLAAGVWGLALGERPQALGSD